MWVTYFRSSSVLLLVGFELHSIDWWFFPWYRQVLKWNIISKPKTVTSLANINLTLPSIFSRSCSIVISICVSLVFRSTAVSWRRPVNIKRKMISYSEVKKWLASFQCRRMESTYSRRFSVFQLTDSDARSLLSSCCPCSWTLLKIFIILCYPCRYFLKWIYPTV